MTKKEPFKPYKPVGADLAGMLKSIAAVDEVEAAKDKIAALAKEVGATEPEKAEAYCEHGVSMDYPHLCKWCNPPAVSPPPVQPPQPRIERTAHKDTINWWGAATFGCMAGALVFGFWALYQLADKADKANEAVRGTRIAAPANFAGAGYDPLIDQHCVRINRYDVQKIVLVCTAQAVERYKGVKEEKKISGAIKP